MRSSLSIVLAEAVLFLHLLWRVWVLLGWTVTRCRPVLRTLHIASLVYAIVIELVPWPPCPLTVAETWLEARAGIEPVHGPFLVRVLDAVTGELLFRQPSPSGNAIGRECLWNQ
jgi:hypothetical protein